MYFRTITWLQHDCMSTAVFSSACYSVIHYCVSFVDDCFEQKNIRGSFGRKSQEKATRFEFLSGFLNGCAIVCVVLVQQSESFLLSVFRGCWSSWASLLVSHAVQRHLASTSRAVTASLLSLPKVKR